MSEAALGVDPSRTIVEQFHTRVNAAAARTHVLFAAVLFGTTGTAQALGPDLQPLAIGAARIAVGAVLLGAMAMLKGGSGAGAPRPILLAGVCVAVYQATFFAALSETGVAVGTVVAIGSAPAFAGLFARAFAGEPLRARWAVATALACAGVCLLVLGGGRAGDVSSVGVGLALVSGAGYAGYAVATKRMLTAGGLLQPGGAALALYLGAIPTALAYVLFARGLERIGAGETATLTLAEPLTAALLGVVALGERPSLLAAAGAALVLSGLAALALRPRTATGARPRLAEAHV